MKIPNLDLNLFKPFIAVYEHKNIARAAEKLFVTPSAISMRIKELSTQLGVTLFVPHARGVHPTDEAHKLYTRIIPAIDRLGSSVDSLGEFTAETSCTIHIGIATNIARYVFLDFICDFMTRFPRVKIKINSDAINTLCDMLVKRDIDLLIYRLPIPIEHDGIVIEKLCALPKSFFASRDFIQKHGIGTTITREQLATLPLIVPDKMRDDAQHIVREINKPLDTFIDISDLVGGNELVYEITKKGMGIGYFNDHCVDSRDNISNIHVQDLTLPTHALAVAYHRDEFKNSTLTFLNELKKSV